MYLTLKHPKESFHQTSITLECDQTTMNTHHGKPKFIKVSLIIEFQTTYSKFFVGSNIYYSLRLKDNNSYRVLIAS